MEHSQFFTELRQLFERFPGIGPRQANRFIWALVDFAPEEQKKLARAITEISQHIRRCSVCFRAFSVVHGEGMCSFCAPGSKRDLSSIMILERDNDLLTMQRAGVYGGLYHVLGGLLNPLEEDEMVRVRIKKLFERVKDSPLKQIEVVLALSPTKLGEFTSEYIKKVLEPIAEHKTITITRLGRGLSTGIEIEYADTSTLKQALDNRK